MQSILGALLTAGYASSFSAAIAASSESKDVSDQVQGELTKSFASADQVAEQYPKYADQIVAAARQSFLDGDDLAYTAGLVAIVLGALLVFFMFPRFEAEKEMLARFHAEDSESAATRESSGRRD
jgi:MFS transporter, DHA2 family, multidrug resistance protein